jgi:hypothetical protein
MKNHALIDPENERPVAESERLLLLQEIQTIIRNYGWQSTAARLLAIASVPLFLYLGMFVSPKYLNNTFLKVAPVVCLILLWLLDGHWKDLQKRYIVLFHDAVESGRNPDLTIQMEETYNVGALWQPLMALTYIMLIIMFAIYALK